MQTGASRAGLEAALRDHQEGRVAEAERGYREILAEHPDDADATHFLGMLRFMMGAQEEGMTLVLRSIETDPANPHAWNNLGNMHVQLRQDAPAEAAYERAVELDARLAAAWFNLARVHIRSRRFERAIEALSTVIRVRQGFSTALQTLAHLYYRLGRMADAGAVYGRWAEESPDDPTPRHMLAALSGRGVPDRAEDRYIVETFDGFAQSFDSALESLGYVAPQLVAARIIEHPLYLTGNAAVLDAGCGTGWCGPLLRPTAKRLVGVDLSSGMLARARARGVYDEFHEAELTAFMRDSPGRFDIIVSTDVLCYFGLLGDAVRAAFDALRPEGLLCFSVEALEEPAAGERFRLGTHGRYAHARAYLESVLAEAGFAPPSIDPAVLRQELGKPVPGYIVGGRRK